MREELLGSNWDKWEREMLICVNEVCVCVPWQHCQQGTPHWNIEEANDWITKQRDTKSKLRVGTLEVTSFHLEHTGRWTLHNNTATLLCSFPFFKVLICLRNHCLLLLLIHFGMPLSARGNATTKKGKKCPLSTEVTTKQQKQKLLKQSWRPRKRKKEGKRSIQRRSHRPPRQALTTAQTARCIIIVFQFSTIQSVSQSVCLLFCPHCPLSGAG